MALEEAQYETGYITGERMRELAKAMNIPESEVYGVASFYSFLSTEIKGKHIIRICRSLPCYIKHSQMIIDAVEKELGIKPGETTEDGLYSLELTNCIGACDKAPAMMIDNDVHGNLTAEKISGILKLYR
jgi:NADH:ubiquinone oxidoreductase subunit E